MYSYKICRYCKSFKPQVSDCKILITCSSGAGVDITDSCYEFELEDNMKRVACMIGFHNYGEWKVVKTRSFMGILELRKIKTCKDCNKEESIYIRDITKQEGENLDWYE